MVQCSKNRRIWTLIEIILLKGGLVSVLRPELLFVAVVSTEKGNVLMILINHLAAEEKTVPVAMVVGIWELLFLKVRDFLVKLRASAYWRLSTFVMMILKSWY